MCIYACVLLCCADGLFVVCLFVAFCIRANEEPLLLHTFYFHGYYPSGVGSVLYHPALRLLIVGSCCDTGETVDMSVLPTVCLHTSK